MANPDSIWAIIPARSGSKGLPGKNLRLLSGAPLIAHTIAAARDSGVMDRVLVSTDDEEIATVAVRYGAESFPRPSGISGDDAPVSWAVRDLLETLGRQCRLPSHFALLQPTSPLRTAAHIRDCLARFRDSRAQSAVGVTEAKPHPLKCLRLDPGDCLSPMFDAEALHAARQVLPLALRQTGAIYLVSVEGFLREQRFIVPPALAYFMTEEDGLDIDSLLDFQLAELLLARRGGREPA